MKNEHIYSICSICRYLSSIANMKHGESDEDYIIRNINWPKSCIDKGLDKANVTIDIYVNHEGMAIVKEIKSISDEELKREITRVIESAKWNPAKIGKHNVVSNYHYSYNGSVPKCG